MKQNPLTEKKAFVSFQLNISALRFQDDYFSKTKDTKLMYIDTNPHENNLTEECISIKNSDRYKSCYDAFKVLAVIPWILRQTKVCIFHICAAQYTSWIAIHC